MQATRLNYLKPLTEGLIFAAMAIGLPIDYHIHSPFSNFA